MRIVSTREVIPQSGIARIAMSPPTAHLGNISQGNAELILTPSDRSLTEKYYRFDRVDATDAFQCDLRMHWFVPDVYTLACEIDRQRYELGMGLAVTSDRDYRSAIAAATGEPFDPGAVDLLYIRTILRDLFSHTIQNSFFAGATTKLALFDETNILIPLTGSLPPELGTPRLFNENFVDWYARTFFEAMAYLAGGLHKDLQVQLTIADQFLEFSGVLTAYQTSHAKQCGEFIGNDVNARLTPITDRFSLHTTQLDGSWIRTTMSGRVHL